MCCDRDDGGMIKAIIFDFDGVIVESMDIKTNAFARLFSREGDDVVRKVIEYHLNNGGVSRYDKFRYIYREILKRPLIDKEFFTLCDRFSELVADRVANAPFVKGARVFLEKYSSQYKCFMVTATPQKEIEDILRKKDIARYFLQVYGAPTSKAEAVKRILEKEELKTRDAVYIGDAMSDYKAAGDNSVGFIAKVSNNAAVFKDINCVKINDLTNLKEIIEYKN